MADITHFKTGFLALVLCVLSFQAAAQSQFSNEPRPEHRYNYQCLIKMSSEQEDAFYISEAGYAGLFQLGVKEAAEGGLCSNPIPPIGQKQIWGLCDFKGPVAQKYAIRNINDLLRGEGAIDAQFNLMKNLSDSYDDYSFQKKYDLSYDKIVNGVLLAPETLRALFLNLGRRATDEFMRGEQIITDDVSNPFAIATCFELCLFNKAEHWDCPRK